MILTAEQREKVEQNIRLVRKVINDRVGCETPSFVAISVNLALCINRASLYRFGISSPPFLFLRNPFSALCPSVPYNIALFL